MAKLVYALNQSLDGYVDHDRFGVEPNAVLFRHFIEDVRSLSGAIYGRRMYETMRYWDEEHPHLDDAGREYAAVWRKMLKWVVSKTLDEVGPNATLISDDVEARVRKLKDELVGVIEIAGPELAASLKELIDEYRIYLHPVVLGSGKPYFAGARPPLRLAASETIGREVIRLIYVPG